MVQKLVGVCKIAPPWNRMCSDLPWNRVKDLASLMLISYRRLSYKKACIYLLQYKVANSNYAVRNFCKVTCCSIKLRTLTVQFATFVRYILVQYKVANSNYAVRNFCKIYTCCSIQLRTLTMRFATFVRYTLFL